MLKDNRLDEKDESSLEIGIMEIENDEHEVFKPEI